MNGPCHLAGPMNSLSGPIPYAESGAATNGRASCVCGLLVVLVLTLPVAAQPPTGHLHHKRTGRFHAEHVLVRFEPGTAASARMAAHAAARGVRTNREYHLVDGLELVTVPRGQVPAAVAAYRRNPNVAYAEPDYEVHLNVLPDDPDFGLLWGFHNTGQTVNNDPGTPGADIRAPGAWDIWSGDPNFKVAVIDTGVDYTHPDLAANVWTNPGEIPYNGVDDDANGYIDDVHGYDFHNNDGDPMDDHAHGTHVSGTIGAVGNNAFGIVGINWRCKIVGLKFLSAGGSGFTSDAIGGLQYCIDTNIRLSNNSWGSGAYSQALYDAIQAAQAAGHLFVAAAGNSGADSDLFPLFPAAFDLDNILSVAAIDNDDQLAFFSNYGAATVDLGAPGVSVYSTLPNGNYGFFRGTSMASPHVAGVAALVMSLNPGISWADARSQILLHVRAIPALAGRTVTGGMLDAQAAVGDCNRNGVPDDVDISSGTSPDCTGNHVPDECEPDCNDNGSADSCDLLDGGSLDCTGNGVPDECEPDCDGNGRADTCDLAESATDCNNNDVPDTCEPDCNNNTVADSCDITSGTSEDCDGDGIPDECEDDCNNNQIVDGCDILDGTSLDCNENDVPDECDIASGASQDCAGNGIPDECEYDCNNNGTADSCEIAAGLLEDADGDGIADICVIGFSLIPVASSGPHTIEGNRIFLHSAGQRVTLEVRLMGWDTDFDGDPRLDLFQLALDASGFSSGQRGTLSYAKFPCTTPGQCKSSPYQPPICDDGFCDARTAFEFDEFRPDFLFYGQRSIYTTFLNPGLPPLATAAVWLGDSVRDLGRSRFAVTIYVDVPSDAEGTFQIDFAPGDPDDPYTFWASNWNSGLTLHPIPEMEGALITLPADCNDNGVTDDQDIAAGTSDDCDANGVPDECLDIEGDCNANSIPDACDLADGTSVDDNANGLPDECEPEVVFVDDDAVGLNNGLSWANAFTDLQDALDLAAVSAGSVKEIWVAEGTYVPSVRTSPDYPRTEAFSLLNGVKLYGGFAGGEVYRAQRDPQAHVAVLSGDRAGDDGSDFANTEENTYHVVVAKDLDATAVLDGFTITGGRADGSPAGWDFTRLCGGGGMLIDGGGPTVSACVFEGNWAELGGGLATVASGATISRCGFIENHAEEQGGGAFNDASDGTTYRHCRFQRNESRYGGGMANDGTGLVVVLNSLFVANTGARNGGGLYSFSPLVLMNSTFAANAATSTPPAQYATGGAAYLAKPPRTIARSNILWANWADGYTDARAQLFPTSDYMILDRNCIQDWTPDLGGTGNIRVDPVFRDADGLDGIPGTDDDDYRLSPGSPAADAGSTGAVPPGLTVDLDGNPRVVNGAVDMGAYEETDCNENGVPDWNDLAGGTSEDCTGNGKPDECEPDCNGNGVADSCDIAGGPSSDCNANGKPDGCDLLDPDVGDCDASGIPDDCELDSDGDRVIDACDDCPNDGGKVAPGHCGCGSPDKDSDYDSVLDCDDLCEGSDDFADSDFDGIPDGCEDCNDNGVDDEDDVIAGTSDDCNANGLPDECERDCNLNDVEDSCDIASGFSVDTGGDGVPDECETPILRVKADATGANDGSSWDDALPDLQDALTRARANPQVREIWVAAGTYLPADPGGSREAAFELVDGVSLLGGFGGWETVVAQRDISANETVLSGEIDGDADSSNNSLRVVVADGVGPTTVLSGFTITQGNADGPGASFLDKGGGLQVLQADPTVTHCTFRNNTGSQGGAVLINTYSHPTFLDCVFAQNNRGVYNYGYPIMINCAFLRNTGDTGAGIYNMGSPRLLNCVLSGNMATSNGAAIFQVDYRAIDLTNCTIVGNHASGLGGGIHGGYVTLKNSILWHNSDQTGSGESAQVHQIQQLLPSHYSCIQGWSGALGGFGNIGADPLFVDADGPDDVFGTEDDDPRLSAGSPCIDAADNAVLPTDDLDLDGDANLTEPVSLDADGTDRWIDDPFTIDTGIGPAPVVDMGAFEYGDDCNGNGIPDDQDIAGGTSQDCTANGTPDECEPDCDGNTTADSCDISDGTAEDCNHNGIPDSCDIAIGRSGDCNANAMPDECELDSDSDGTVDDCDDCPVDENKTEPGACGCGASDLDSDLDTVADCNDICPGYDDLTDADADETPDGCDLCAGHDDRLDDDADTVPDGCDVCPGYDDRQDSDADAVPDACDQCPGYDDALDCNCNEIPDGCDLVDATSRDADGSGVPDECELVPTGIAASRAIALNMPQISSGTQTAIRVTVVEMYVEEDDDPVAGCPVRTSQSDLAQFNGAVRWLGPPEEFSEDNQPPTANFLAAQLQCCPYFRDWSQEALASEFSAADASVVHAYGPAALPCSEYEVRQVTESCLAQGVTAPGQTARTGRWGDLWAPWGLANFQDIGKVVEKFRGVPYQPGPPEQGGPPKIRAMLRGTILPLGEKVNFIDIGKAVEAFKHIPFNESGPSTCPPCP